jgi:tetratricopeptide (TPR) repeat protein
MKRILVLVALIAAMPLAAQVADGDAHWAKRGEGSQAGRAKSPEVDAAIGAYQKAVAANANDLDAQWKLLRAIRFKGAYVASSNDDKKVVYSQAKKAGDNALAVVDRQLRAKGITSVTKATEKQVADAARQIAGAGEIFFWDSVNWGEWALVYGKLAAVKEGAADRIKRESTIAMLVDAKMEAGGPARVLGRLHDQTPHVPFITGWASNKEAVKYLNESLKIDPANKITKVFLAEAMVDNDSDTKPAATQMLRDVVNAPNAADFEVEWAAATNDARALLRKWGT